MSSGMPELGSKISLISKADIRYEGRLFTVDPQECTIALASVRSFGTEDRETQFPVAPQSQVYDYILFRGSDIKDIRVLNNVPSLPNDPAIMQMSVPPTLGAAANSAQFPGQFNHPVVGQTQYPQYHPMAGFPGSVHGSISKTSELSPQTAPELAQVSQSATAPIGTQVPHHGAPQVKDQGSMLDLISGGSHQGTSRSGTPSVAQRKSPTSDQGTQVGAGAGSSRQDTRRGSKTSHQQMHQANTRARNNSKNRQRYPNQANNQANSSQAHSMQQHQMPPQSAQLSQHHNSAQQYNHQGQGYGRGGWRGRPRGRGRGGFVPRNKNTLKFDNDYDFEQANTEFEELRSQLAKTKISDGDSKPEVPVENVLGVEVEKKDDSGNETGAGEAEAEDDTAAGFTGYDKAKSFFDNISCEAVERSKGRSQRTDWRTERKLNSETFGVASARRGAWRGRGGWRHGAPHHAWRPNNMRGGRGRPAPSAPAPARAPRAAQPPAPPPAAASAAN